MTPIADDYINNNHVVSTLTDAAKHVAGKKLFAKLVYFRRITAFKWQTNNHSTSLHSTSRVEHSLTEDRQKDSIVSYHHFEALSANKSIQSSKLTNVHKTLNLDDIGITANTPQQLIINPPSVFQCLKNDVLKLSMT